MCPRFFNLILVALLLLPPGFCPCHMLEHSAGHEHSECSLSRDEETQISESPVSCTADDRGAHALALTQHQDHHSSDCLARQLTETKFTNQSPPTGKNPGLAGFPSALPETLFTFRAGIVLCPCLTFTSACTPIYLKVRALRL